MPPAELAPAADFLRTLARVMEDNELPIPLSINLYGEVPAIQVYVRDLPEWQLYVATGPWETPEPPYIRRRCILAGTIPFDVCAAVTR